MTSDGLSKKKIESLATRFVAALGQDSEEVIHAFLVQNPFLLKSCWYEGCLMSKFRLSDRYITDFLAIGNPGTKDPRPRVTFVEIERPDGALFTRRGDPTAFLTRAVRQVQDWKRWVKENRSHFQHELELYLDGRDSTKAAPIYHWGDEPRREAEETRWRLKRCVTHGFSDDYVVIVGRRESLTVSDRLRLAQMNDDLHNIEIMTYDILIDHIIRLANRSLPRGLAGVLSEWEF